MVKDALELVSCEDIRDPVSIVVHKTFELHVAGPRRTASALPPDWLPALDELRSSGIIEREPGKYWAADIKERWKPLRSGPRPKDDSEIVFALAQYLINNEPRSREDLAAVWERLRAELDGGDGVGPDAVGHPSSRPFVRQLARALTVAEQDLEAARRYDAFPEPEIYEICAERLRTWRTGLSAGRRVSN